MTKRTVLVIEDNPITRKVVRLTLGNAGFAVSEAEDGAGGVALAERAPPDLVLQDLLLPDMDGFELVRRLRALPGLTGVPIIAFSGFLSRLEYGRAAALGFTDFLPKPVDPARLLQVVHAHLPEEQAAADSPGAGRRLLVVDDDPVQLKLARLRLAGCGFTVATATDGADALEVLAGGAPVDAVLSDVLMPRLDGFRLCEAIRSDPRLCDLPVVLVSSNYVEEADREVARGMGASGFVVRTPDLADAIRALEDAMDRPLPGSPAPAPGVSLQHHDRVVRQLERQAAMNAAFAHRTAMHASMLSVVAGVSEALTRRHSIEGALSDILGSLLDASGVSSGALFLVTDDELRLSASTGFSAERAADLGAFCGQRRLFDRAALTRAPVVLGAPGDGDPGVRDLLARTESGSALLVPFMSDHECLGILLLASNARDLTEADWLPFARTMAAQIGQALSLNRAFARLAASEDRYRRIVSTTNEGVWVMDAAGLTTFMNARMGEMLGCDPAETIGVSPAEFLDEEGHAVFAQHIERHRAGLPCQSEVRLLRRDGTSLWTLLGSTPMFDAAGRHEGALAMVMDLTARKEAEAAERASQRALLERMKVAEMTAEVGFALSSGTRLEAALELSARAIAHHLDVPLVQVFTVDAGKGELELRASGGALDGGGEPPEQAAIGRGPVGVAAGEQQVCVIEDLAADPRAGDCTWATRQGVTSFVGHPLLVGGERIGVLALWSRRPPGEAMIAGLAPVASACAVAIQRKLALRARDALEGQLRQAQKMEAVGRLAGGVAHDFNNLLSIILSYGDLLLEDMRPGEPMRDDIEQMRDAASRAAQLTRQLLLFSRQQVLDPRVLDLNDILAGMDKMLRRLLGTDVELTTVPAPGLGPIRGDGNSLEQVIMNLAVNARDAMPTGGQLTVETADVILDEAYAREHHGVRPGRYVMLAVSDTGTGMDAATQARIFEPFFTTKEKGKGTGLGLSTVFGIVRQGDGNVWVYSEPGHGTTFKIFFPRVDAALDSVAAAVPALAALRGAETILLVEDDDQVRAVVVAVLRRQGYHVHEARNGGEALLLCERVPGPIHLLLSDIVMPHMSGPEVAGRLQQIRPDMKVLLMSGYTDDTVVRHGLIGNGVAYLQKPIIPDVLARKVRAVLSSDAPAPSST